MENYDEIELLLIEDNPADIELILRALKKINITNNVVVLSDGEEARDFLFCTGRYKSRDHNIQPQVILLDLKLPKIEGLEILKMLKEDPVRKSIPVVVLTSSSEEKDIVCSYEFGVNSYIVKPVNSDKFTEAIHKVGIYWLMLNKKIKPDLVGERNGKF